MNDLREKMYADLGKRGPSFANKDKMIAAFDRDEARWVDSSEMVDIDVELNGVHIGKSKILGCLDNDVTERNIKWMGYITTDRPALCQIRVYINVGDFKVDKESGVIRISKGGCICRKCGFTGPEMEVDSIEGSILKLRNWCCNCNDAYFENYKKIDI